MHMSLSLHLVFSRPTTLWCTRNVQNGSACGWILSTAQTTALRALWQGEEGWCARRRAAARAAECSAGESHVQLSGCVRAAEEAYNLFFLSFFSFFYLFFIRSFSLKVVASVSTGRVQPSGGNCSAAKASGRQQVHNPCIIMAVQSFKLPTLFHFHFLL